MNKIRSSQVITTFGPGAMVDFPDCSVIIAGLDQWNYDKDNVPVIDEPRLLAKVERLLNRTGLSLRSPPPTEDMPTRGYHPGVTGWRFPEWFIVQHAVFAPSGFRRRRLVHLNSLERGCFIDSLRERRTVVPVRFVRACKRGHVGDIDWQAFVHGVGESCSRDLWMEERGTSGDLDQVWIVCDCGRDRVMSQAARMELRALGHCNGSRPWLGAGTREQCGDVNKLLIRSASNAYFPQLLSVISIPDTKAPLDDIVRALWADYLSEVSTAADLAKERKKPTIAARLSGVTDAQLMSSINRVRAGGKPDDRPVKDVEFEALAEAKDELGIDTPGGDFFARTLDRTAWDAPWMAPIERVVLVHRLREVAALVGFTRFEAAGPDIRGELDIDVRRAALSIDCAWHPAVENRGEGVFLQFRKDTVAAWLGRASVEERGRALLAGFSRWQAEHEGTSRTFPGLPYYLLHSFSHMLVTAVSLECGYPASSLRERIYALDDDRYGILLYTGTSDAEGTLGGLVAAARDIRRHVRRALEYAALCSNDPVCSYHQPGTHDHQPLHGSACHGCLLISETSCEQHNDYLDRALVVETVENAGASFFPPFL